MSKSDCPEYGPVAKCLISHEMSIKEVEDHIFDRNELIARLDKGEDVRVLLREFIVCDVRVLTSIADDAREEMAEVVEHFAKHHGHKPR